MTSNDNPRYVTVEMFNDSMTRIERRFDAIDRKFEKIDQTLNELTKEIHAIDRRAEINSVKIDELHYFVGVGFAIMAVVVTLVGYMMSGSASRKEEKTDTTERMKRDILDTVRSEMRLVADEVVSRALGAKKQ